MTKLCLLGNESVGLLKDLCGKPDIRLQKRLAVFPGIVNLRFVSDIPAGDGITANFFYSAGIPDLDIVL
jgi:hypothetical protein